MTRFALTVTQGLLAYTCALYWVSACLAEPSAPPQAAKRGPKSSSRAAQAQLQERGALSRQEIAPYLKQGPQPIMGALRLYPVRDQGRFVGFKILMIAPGSPPERAGLMVGDVLLKINGQPIARPEQVMQVWEGLSSAQALTVSFKRGPALLTYRWQLSP